MLDQCLGALSTSTVKPLECIVVDDASTDGALEVAERHGARFIILGERLGPAQARNLGALHARGDLILFLDADVRIHADAIARILDDFRLDPSLDAVIGAYDDAPAAPPFLSQYRNLLHCFTHRAGRPEASTFWAGCGTIRKEAFLRCGGFDDRYDRPAIEDIELGSRLKANGSRILLDATVQVQHLKHWTLASMLKTDIFDRGIPWTRLILRAGSLPNDLNVRWSQRLSVALAFLLMAGLYLGSVKAAIGCALAMIGLNWPFYAFLAALRGLLFAFRAMPLHVLFHIYSAVAFLLGVCLHLVSLIRPSVSEVPGEEAS
ncbi:MAG: glycosyl transferase family 2 [Bryobacterales bacterium]|nr:glycosyl transferase family 2 [Bryobacterales bacterium]